MQLTPELPSSARELTPEPEPAPTKSGESWMGTFQAHNRAILGVVVYILVSLIVAWPTVQALLRHKTVPSGEAAPWSAQLAQAQQLVDKTEKGSVLITVSAAPADNAQGIATGTLVEDFSFISPSPRRFSVREEDTQPLYTYPDTGEANIDYSRGYTPERAAVLTAGVSAVKLSPRDALKTVLQELGISSAATEKESRYISIRLYINGDLSDKDPRLGDAKAAWSVDYFRVDEGGAVFLIDASSGKVLQKDLKNWRGPATPTP
jgi:hypothetical protein